MFYGLNNDELWQRRSWLILGVAVLAIIAFIALPSRQSPFLSTWNGGQPQQARPEPAQLSGAFGAVESDGMSVIGPPSISVAQIEAVLADYASPAQGSGQAMYDLGIQYGIDPAFCLAFFIQESSAGTKGIATVTRSVGNIRVTPGYEEYQGFRRYATWEEGMEDWYKLIRELYIEGWQLTTIEEIIPVYAPPIENHTDGYIETVRRLVLGWRGAQ